MPTTTDRFERQRDLVPRDTIVNLDITVIGVGAIGRQVAIQLAAMGAPRVRLYDFDKVAWTNVTSQAYDRDDARQQRYKVFATADAMKRLEPTMCIVPVVDRFRPKHEAGDVVFCCVDSIAAREAIWRAVRSRVHFWVDGRMLGESIRVLAAADADDHVVYEQSLFAPSEATRGSCTARSTIFAASIAAGLMVNQFARFLRELPIDRDATINLLAGEWTVKT